MGERHGVPSVAALPEHEYDRQILQAIATGNRVTQRALAGELGVALGLTNLLPTRRRVLPRPRARAACDETIRAHRCAAGYIAPRHMKAIKDTGHDTILSVLSGRTLTRRGRDVRIVYRGRQ